MELLLNLIWAVISAAALLAWICRRRNSSSDVLPEMLRGVVVVVCILVLLFPVISISDDLSQTLSMAEGNRLQDVLKAPDLRGVLVSTTLPALSLLLQPEQHGVARSSATEPSFNQHEIFWTPFIEKRPPPVLA